MRYTIVLTPDLEDGGYTVEVPALPGCVTQGETMEEAIANAREAIALHVAVLMAHGDPVPADVSPAIQVVEFEAPPAAV
jgi:predicted RNase H-like HicB family nuclease